MPGIIELSTPLNKDSRKLVLRRNIKTYIAASFMLAALLVLCLQYKNQLCFMANYVANPFSTKEKILLVWHSGYGENEQIARLKIGASHIGIDLRIVNDGSKIHYSIMQPVETAMQIFKPDFLLLIEEFSSYYRGVPNYMTLTHGEARYFDLSKRDTPVLKLPHLLEFDAILYSSKNTKLLEAELAKQGKNLQGFLWYPTMYVTKYEPGTPQKLFYSGGTLWDKTRSSPKYLELYQMLDKTGYFQVSGPEKVWQHLSKSWIGVLPFDGNSLIKHINSAGIELILHHIDHIKGAAPTGRIFEAVAANVVIISDKHPFIIEHFGNNVLYIDIEQDALGIFSQINDHVHWIMNHPEAAQQMAANCHKIFKEKFSLEDQLQKLLNLHRDLQLQKKYIA